MRNLLISVISSLYVVVLFAQQDEQPIHIFKEHKDAVKSLVFSSDGTLLTTGSSDKTAIIWQLSDYRPLVTLGGHVAEVKALSFSSKAQKIYTAADRSIRVFDYTGKQLFSLGATATYIWSISFNNDETLVTTGSYDPTVYILSNETKSKVVAKIKHHQKSVLVSKYSPNGKYIATGSLDQSICIWSADSFKLLKTFKSHGGNIFDIEWFADNKKIVSASADKTARIWDIEKGSIEKILEGHTGALFTVAISTDGLFIYTGSADKTLIMWEVATGKIIYIYNNHTQTINDIAMSNDGKYFASASDDATAILWHYKPQLVVDTYFSEEVKKEMDANPLFLPKAKDENKADYLKRIEEAAKAKNALYDAFYKKYLEINK